MRLNDHSGVVKQLVIGGLLAWFNGGVGDNTLTRKEEQENGH
jgi:hypothetical protein